MSATSTHTAMAAGKSLADILGSALVDIRDAQDIIATHALPVTTQALVSEPIRLVADLLTDAIRVAHPQAIGQALLVEAVAP